MKNIDRAELKALLAELLEEIRVEALGKLTGAKLEFQRAAAAMRDAESAMYTSIVSASAAQAASVSNLAFNRIEADEQETAALKEELHESIEQLAQRIDAGASRLIDVQTGANLRIDIANEQRDAGTDQMDGMQRELTALKERVAALEAWLGPVIRTQPAWRQREGERE